MKNNKKGFVLAYTVIIMGVVFVVMAVLVSMLALQKGIDKASIANFEQKMFVSQQQYNYANLTYENYITYLNNNSINKQEDEVQVIYNFDAFVVELKKDYSQIIVYNVDKSKVLFEKTR